MISAGGGLPIPYRADEPAFDVARFRDTWLAARDRIAREIVEEMIVPIIRMTNK